MYSTLDMHASLHRGYSYMSDIYRNYIVLIMYLILLIKYLMIDAFPITFSIFASQFPKGYSVFTCNI